MTADVDVRCMDCGSSGLRCADCDSRGESPEALEPVHRPWLSAAVADSIRSMRCPCSNDGGHWLVCAYHQGYVAALEEDR